MNDEQLEALERDIASAREEARRANEGVASLRGGRLANADELQSRRVSGAAPVDNELMGWNATTKKWEPKGGAPAARVHTSGTLSPIGLLPSRD